MVIKYNYDTICYPHCCDLNLKINYSIINYYLGFMANYTIMIISLYLQLHARNTFRYAKMYVSSTRDKPLDSSANASELDRILLHFGLY